MTLDEYELNIKPFVRVYTNRIENQIQQIELYVLKIKEELLRMNTELMYVKEGTSIKVKIGGTK